MRNILFVLTCRCKLYTFLGFPVNFNFSWNIEFDVCLTYIYATKLGRREWGLYYILSIFVFLHFLPFVFGLLVTHALPSVLEWNLKIRSRRLYLNYCIFLHSIRTEFRGRILCYPNYLVILYSIKATL